MKIWHFSLFIIAVVFFLAVIYLALDSRPFLANASSVNISAVVISQCGNGVIDSGEQCDGSNLGSETCESRGFTGGILSCSNCAFDTSGCTGPSAPPSGGGGGGGGVVPPPTVTKVILQGKAYPLAKITVLKDGKLAIIIAGDSQANFKAEFSDIAPGVYTFGLWAEDKEGRRSITFSFTLTVNPNMITTVSGIFIPPTVELDKVNLARGENLTILGQTAPESQLSIHIESPQEIIKKTTAKESGDWNYLLNTETLEEGMHTTRAKAESPEGLLSSFSKVLAFYVGKYGTTEICPEADFNKDGRTNLTDFSIMLYWWGKYNPCVDQNKDGIVNLPDFSILMYYWTG